MIITYTSTLYLHARARSLGERERAARDRPPACGCGRHTRTPAGPRPRTHGTAGARRPRTRPRGRRDPIATATSAVTRFVPCHTSARRERGDEPANPRSPSLTSLPDFSLRYLDRLTNAVEDQTFTGRLATSDVLRRSSVGYRSLLQVSARYRSRLSCASQRRYSVRVPSTIRHSYTLALVAPPCADVSHEGRCNTV